MLIALVHWNTRLETQSCLASLLPAADAGHRVLVVDNGSAVDDGALFQRLHSGIRCLRLPENRGYAAALNLAREQCLAGGYRGLLMLNADCVVESDTVAQLLIASTAHPDAVLACLVLNGDGSAIAMPEKFLHADGRWRKGRNDRPIDHRPDQYAAMSAIQSAHGAAWYVPRGLLARPFLDERFFLYCEETDFCLRVAKLGTATWLVPTARVRHCGHLNSARSPAMERLLDYYRSRNEIELWRRHGGAWWYWIVLRKGIKVLGHALLLKPGTGYLAQAWCDGVRGRLGKRYAPESLWP
ncbi:glycosyltransferase family 2 protein [Ahniella affigens]|nr:glycosyltransferase family 2 protein [Ahniella affigens]